MAQENSPVCVRLDCQYVHVLLGMIEILEDILKTENDERFK